MMLPTKSKKLLTNWIMLGLVGGVVAQPCLASEIKTFPESTQTNEASRLLDQLIQNAKIALASQDYHKLLALLQKFESDFAGNSTYDYYLGTAYLELGHYSEAIFTLERAVTQNPKQGGATFELGRAYFYNEEYAESKIIFERLLGLKPPENLEQIVLSFLRQIEEKEKKFYVTHQPVISFSLGYDTNANTAPAIEQIGFIQLARNNQETASSFYSLAFTDLYSVPTSNYWRWQTRASAYLRSNPDAEFIDTRLGVLQTGFAWSQDSESLTLDLGRIHSRVEGEPLAPELLELVDYQTENLDRQGSFINISLATGSDAGASYTFSSKLARFEHEPVLSIRDMTQLSFDFGAQFDLSPGWRYDLHFTFDHDDTLNDLSPYDNKRLGLKMAFSHPFGVNLYSRLGFNYSETEYSGLFLGKLREDRTSQVDLMLRKLVGKNVSYWAKLQWMENRSNDDYSLYDFQKASAEVGVSYEF